MELISYVAEKLSAEQQAELNAAVLRTAQLQAVNKMKKSIRCKMFAITLWKFEITVSSVRKQVN
ncbi:hypothetical protein [Paenibacillus alkalitolerans]|uniref:hypothetical protein n=1 Tax=Paenibacillus alkalitolerans TaxID=2799335 RepID=UPI0018F75C21|nr:hypothetical protein [Paenibacillus alkalitolerans]